MTEKLLIGLHGKPRSGKDTLAAHLIKKFNLLRYGPSVPVKDGTAAMFDIPREYLDDDSKKDTYDPYWKMTYREMAQKVGKESSRDVFGEDFWMRHVQRKWVSIRDERTLDGKYNTSHVAYRGMILADIRYANEIDWVKSRGGSMIFITRDNLPVSSGVGHAAEAGLPIELADVVVYNNGSIEDLYTQINVILAFSGIE
jgi:hypothetical protein